MVGYITSPQMNVARNEAMTQFRNAHLELLTAARRYLNGGAVLQE
ncbi:hypothetical protein ABZX90_38510 [Streptomyces sp. NPDC002935]